MNKSLLILTTVMCLSLNTFIAFAVVPAEITTDTKNDMMPAAIDDSTGTVYAVYSSDMDGNYDIFYQTSGDRGPTWSAPKKITSSNSNELQPSIIQDSHGVYRIVYTSDSASNTEVWQITSTDGQTWSAPSKITNSSENKMRPTIIQDTAGKYWVSWAVSVYEVSVGLVDKVQYITSTDGTTWSDINVFSIGTTKAANARLSASSGKYCMVYEAQDTIYYSESNDAASWSTPTAISAGTGNAEPMHMVSADGKHYAIWTSVAGGNNDIFYSSSADGTIWSSPSALTMHPASDASGYLLQDKNRNFWLFFRSDRVTENRDIWFMKDGSIPVETEPVKDFCGDKVCSIGESCETCPSDCACTPSAPPDPCNSVVCPDKCKGTTKYTNGYCVGEGDCAYAITTEKSAECGYIEEHEPIVEPIIEKETIKEPIEQPPQNKSSEVNKSIVQEPPATNKPNEELPSKTVVPKEKTDEGESNVGFVLLAAVFLVLFLAGAGLYICSKIQSRGATCLTDKRLLTGLVLSFLFFAGHAHAWDVWARFDNAYQGPFRPFTSSPGTVGTTYYADFDTNDTFGPNDQTKAGRYVQHCETGCGTGCRWANMCRSDISSWCTADSCDDNPYDLCVCFDRSNCYKIDGWFAQRNKITANKYTYEILGQAHADCAYSGWGYVKGASVLNSSGEFQITSVDYCSAQGSNKGQTTYCNVNMAAGTIDWAGGNTCGGCCCCEDSGGLNVKVTVESIADTNPPTLVSFTDPGNAWTNNCNISTSWSCSDTGSGMHATEPYKLYIYYSESWHNMSWGTNTSYTYTAAEFDNIAFGLECKDAAGNIGGPWYTTQYTKCDRTSPAAAISINNGAPATKTTNVTLTLGYTDIGSGIDSCRYKNDGSGWTGWQSCTPSKTWTLEAGDGLKTVYYDVKDKVENINQTTDTIILDTTPPRVTVSHSPSAVIPFENVTFTAACDDVGGSGCSITNITIPALGKYCSITNGSGSCQITISDCDHSPYTYYTINATDIAGNSNTTESGSFICITEMFVFQEPEGDLSVRVGEQGSIMLKLTNLLNVPDTLTIEFSGTPSKIGYWSWFNGHRYDEQKMETSVTIGPEESANAAIIVFGGEVLDSASTIYVKVKSAATGISTELSKKVYINYGSEDGSMFTQTPEFGWMGYVAIGFIAAFLLL